MIKTRPIFRCLIFSALIFIGCQSTSNDKKVENSSSKTPPAASKSDLPMVQATFTGEKYVDWKTRPVESEHGPADPWTWTHMMCNGPSFLEENIKASSTLAPQGKNAYSASNVCDDDPTTAWVEGKPDYGIGEFLEMKWVPMNDGEISLLNGYQISKSAWENNSRVKKMKVSVGGKALCIIELADVMGVQKFKIPDLVVPSKNGYQYNIDGAIRFTITEVYPGLKYKDTAISGIFSCGG